jgi:outer membrane protein assembly factor BamB
MKRWLLGLSMAAIAGCSWFGGESGETPAELVSFEPTARVTELWSLDTGSGPDEKYVRLTPAQGDDTLYACDTRGRVRALDRSTGKERWLAELKLDVTSGVGVGDGLVLVATRKGEVAALDKNTGREQWRATVSTEVLAPPAAANGVVVVQSVDGRLTALSSATGQRLWLVERSEPALSLRGTATPVILGDAVLTGFATGKLMAVGLREGKVLWETVVAQPQGRTEVERLIDVDVPVLAAGQILLTAAFQGKIVALSIESGRILWSREISTAMPLVADGNNVYVSDARGQVYALDRQNGATVWKQDKLHGRRLSAPAVVGDAVAVGDFEGYVHWLARDDGRFIARERPSRAAILSAPLADGATLFVLSQNANLAALRLDPLRR